MLTEAYRRQQEQMHLNERYGAASAKMAGAVQALVNSLRPASILDYGAGKGMLRKCLRTSAAFVEYDPAVPAIAELPDGKFDLVCCIDVLEHVEPEFLEAVLGSIRERTGKAVFMSIHTGPAGKFLPDGRNAHLIQQDITWWEQQLSPHFKKVKAKMISGTTIVAVCR